MLSNVPVEYLKNVLLIGYLSVLYFVQIFYESKNLLEISRDYGSPVQKLWRQSVIVIIDFLTVIFVSSDRLTQILIDQELKIQTVYSICFREATVC